jgi:hypothetical protein
MSIITFPFYTHRPNTEISPTVFVTGHNPTKSTTTEDALNAVLPSLRHTSRLIYHILNNQTVRLTHEGSYEDHMSHVFHVSLNPDSTKSISDNFARIQELFEISKLAIKIETDQGKSIAGYRIYKLTLGEIKNENQINYFLLDIKIDLLRQGNINYGYRPPVLNSLKQQMPPPKNFSDKPSQIEALKIQLATSLQLDAQNPTSDATNLNP